MSDIGSRPKLNLAAIFASTGRALWRSGPSLTLLTLVAALVSPTIQLAAGLAGQSSATGLGLAGRLLANTFSASLSGYFSVVVTGLALSALAGRPNQVGAAFRQAGRPWLVLLPLTLVLSAGSFLQPILLALHYPYGLIGSLSGLATLGTIILVLLWGVAAPVAVAERGGLISTLARSWRLLGRGRWLFALFYFGLLLLQGLATMLAFSAIGGLSGGNSDTMRALSQAAVIVPQAILFPLWRTFAAAYYLELCRLRDGAAPGEVASIFE